MRPSGAVLGTVTGTAAVTVGLAASFTPDLLPAVIFVRGMWWWTIGKMWTETDVLPRSLGLATAALGAVSFAAAILAAFAGPLQPLIPALSAPGTWIIGRYVTALWLAWLAWALGTLPDVPSG